MGSDEGAQRYLIVNRRQSQPLSCLMFLSKETTNLYFSCGHVWKRFLVVKSILLGTLNKVVWFLLSETCPSWRLRAKSC